ncbi:MAG: polyprenyl synthetase family protein [Candidatus Micrarchaeota archaeon]|nr:polyprenyl synthetase family protein [Candidatus Micrarchaeota archaeon]
MAKNSKNLEKKLAEINAPVKAGIAALLEGKKEPTEVYGLLSEFFSRKGKSLRPALCIECCKAVGGRPEEALQAAVAIELFHNFTLIHDDIEDGSLMRRGTPCLHVKYGLPLALNAGDGLFMMVWQAAQKIEGPKRERVISLLLSSFTKVLEGQAAELGWYYKNKWDVTEPEYYRVIEGKTGALIAASCEAGAILGNADEETCKQMSGFGMDLGLGFQIIDDVLNIVGDESKYGKEIGGDIQEGKRTLITIWALRTLPAVKKAKLELILKKKKKSAMEIRAAITLIKESGAPEEVMKVAESLVDRAIGRLDVLPDGEEKKTLCALANYVTRRQK